MFPVFNYDVNTSGSCQKYFACIHNMLGSVNVSRPCSTCSHWAECSSCMLTTNVEPVFPTLFRQFLVYCIHCLWFLQSIAEVCSHQNPEVHSKTSRHSWVNDAALSATEENTKCCFCWIVLVAYPFILKMKAAERGSSPASQQRIY